MHIIGVIILQQYMIQKGLKLFGDGGRQAVMKEPTQLHKMVMDIPMYAMSLQENKGFTHHLCS